jgi:glutamine amidotransferase
MNKEILIIDYKVGNVQSVIKAVKNLGYSVIFSDDKKDLDKARKIILPGQGSYDFAMKKLNDLDLSNVLINKSNKEGIPILGICLGMQILSSKGFENCETNGLNLIPGKVKKLESKPNKIPHIGWNSLILNNFKNKILKNFSDCKDFYFLHSYFFDCEESKDILGLTEYNQEFPSLINRNNVYGAQFHPEKSLKNGMKILKNFLEIND